MQTIKELEIEDNAKRILLEYISKRNMLGAGTLTDVRFLSKRTEGWRVDTNFSLEFDSINRNLEGLYTQTMPMNIYKLADLLMGSHKSSLTNSAIEMLNRILKAQQRTERIVKKVMTSGPWGASYLSAEIQIDPNHTITRSVGTILRNLLLNKAFGASENMIYTESRYEKILLEKMCERYPDYNWELHNKTHIMQELDLSIVINNTIYGIEIDGFFHLDTYKGEESICNGPTNQMRHYYKMNKALFSSETFPKPVILRAINTSEIDIDLDDVLQTIDDDIQSILVDRSDEYSETDEYVCEEGTNIFSPAIHHPTEWRFRHDKPELITLPDMSTKWSYGRVRWIRKK